MHEDHDRVAAIWQEVESWIVVELRQDRDVRLIIDQGLQHRLRIADTYRHLHPRKALIKAREHLGHVKWAYCTDPQVPRLQFARILEQMHSLAFELKNLLCDLEQLFAEQRKRDFMSAPVEKLAAVCLLEKAHLGGYSRLADMQ